MVNGLCDKKYFFINENMVIKIYYINTYKQKCKHENMK